MCTSNNKYNCEILAPAGTYETMIAAFNAGADAVYVGGSMFGARAFAGNFNEEELINAINYAHLIGKKLYLTVNTLLKDEEIDNSLYNYIKPYYEIGLDAVIVQDLGVMQFISDKFPNLPIHCSTQMTITGANYAKIFKNTHVTRIVTPRELNLNEIRKIYEETNLEIESFVHGALCYCYSGQCLLSSMIGGRSGNRGRCAQPCRLPYNVNELGIKDKYILSPKDLCTLEILPDILDAHVYSLKIEGRMKKPEYVASVVSIYRKYVDKLVKYGRNNYKVLEEDIELLKEIYNRGGFTEGFYKKHNDRSIMSIDRPNHNGVLVGDVVNVNKNVITFRVSKSIIKGDVLELGENEFYAPYDVNKGATFEYKGKFRSVNKGMRLIRTRNDSLINSILKQYLYNDKGEYIYINKIVNIDVFANVGKNIVVKVWDKDCLVEYVGPIVDAAVNKPLSIGDIEKQMRKTGGTEFVVNKVQVDIYGDIFIPVGTLNEIRRECLNEFKQKCLSKYHRMLLSENKTDEEYSESYECINKNELSDNEDGSYNRKITILVSNYEQLEEVFKEVSMGLQIERLYIEYANFTLEDIRNIIDSCKNKCLNIFLAMPYIVRDKAIAEFERDIEIIKNLEPNGYLFRNLENYYFFKNNNISMKTVIFDSNIYAYNKYDVEFLKKIGANILTVSYELNSKELKGFNLNDKELCIYGHIPVMFSAGCIHKTAGKCKMYSNDKKNELNKENSSAKMSIKHLIDMRSVIELEDRKNNIFKGMNICRYCYNIIYNCVPLSLLNLLNDVSNLKFNSYRISFTVESKEQTRNILKCINENDYSILFASNYTKGHFKRGVD